MCSTAVLVRYPFRIRPKDQIDSYDEAMDSAETVIQNITNRSTPLHDNVQIRFEGLDNELSDSGEYLSITINFNVIHYISL